ncbi:hypothetical protein KA005_62980 [bacterium]|nr:hypothetical protein [bacterium]
MNDQPLIYDFIETKINTTGTINFEYSEKHDLNVVSFNGKVIPFVKLAKEEIEQSNLYELMTKTLERREEEDQDVFNLLELYTKTEQKREDEDMFDTRAYFQNLFDLYTKTRQERESEEDGISVSKYGTIPFDLL